jgi:hypothetical protein
MNFDERVQAVAKFGFTDRQARFLVTVMLHAGMCVPRQYARFVGTAYGHNVTKFFDELVQRRYATASDCLHNRAALYHVQHQALYRAIGQPQSRYRRPVSARQAIDRVRLLDGVISHPELTGPFDSNVRSFLQRHAELLRALPGWTLQLLFIRRAEGMMSTFANAVREELTGRFSPHTMSEFKWYCQERRDTSDLRARCQSDARFWRAHRAFSSPRFQMLYSRWLTDGDAVFESASSSAIEQALARGTARIESHVLLCSYDHLSPLVSLVRSSPQGVEEGDTATTQPQPLRLRRSRSPIN